MGYVGLGGCLSFLLSFVLAALFAGTYTVYYLGVQNALDGEDQMIDVKISVALGLAADVYGALLFLFMIFGCVCGCCKKEEEYQSTHAGKDYGGSNLAV